MKTFYCLLFLLICCSLPVSAYPSDLGDLRLSLISGDVQVNSEEMNEWTAAAVNMPLKDGDRIWIPEGGRAELQLRDGTFIRLDENSSLDVLTIERESSHFFLQTGHAYVNFRGLGDSLIQIDTPVSSVRVYATTKFMIDVFTEGSTDISAVKGEVYIEHRNGSTTIHDGHTLSLSGSSYADIHRSGQADSWGQWNRERDKQVGRSYSTRYLPEELASYSYDFDTYGKWVYVREYGYCWMPSSVVTSGWAPYRVGRWVWLDGDYVWVAYEPWGWAPYHYGRWAYVGAAGWCWVPPARGSVYWGPGFVGWVNTPGYVSWVPLSPGEIYYGYGYYGPHSVNITTVNVNKVVIKNVYKNASATNAVTIMSHDTFVTGRQTEITVKDNPFFKEKINVGRPDIKPEKSSFIPLVRAIPPAKEPPAAIRDKQFKELREQHQFIKERPAGLVPAPRKNMSSSRGKTFELQEKTPATPTKIAPVKKALQPKPPAVKQEEHGRPAEKRSEKARELPPTVEKGAEHKPVEKVPEWFKGPRSFKEKEKEGNRDSKQ